MLASIPPILKVPARNADVDAYNAVIPQIVQEQKALNHKIEFADIHSVFAGPADLNGDKVHPQSRGLSEDGRALVFRPHRPNRAGREHAGASVIDWSGRGSQKIFRQD